MTLGRLLDGFGMVLDDIGGTPGPMRKGSTIEINRASPRATGTNRDPQGPIGIHGSTRIHTTRTNRDTQGPIGADTWELVRKHGNGPIWGRHGSIWADKGSI